MEGDETDRVRDRCTLRENRSKAPPLTKEPSTIELFRKGARAKSIQESETKLFSKIRESSKPCTPRSVSFNGVSIVIDSLLSTYSSLSRMNLPEMLEAVQKEDLKAVRNLLEKNMVDMKDVLFKCVELNKHELLSCLLDQVADVNIRHGDNGQALLHVAALKGSLECAKVLLSRGADINVWDTNNKMTPLHCATLNNDRSMEMMELLVNNSADVNAGILNDGGSVLHSAVRENNIGAVRFLLQQNVQTVPRAFFESPLHTAAENNCHEIAELLLTNNGMLVDALKGETKRLTGLHLAADYGYPEITKVLLRYNANVSLKCSNLGTALHFAARSRSEPVLRLILEKARNADVGLVNEQDADGRTALLVCTGTKGQGVLECMKTLIEHGADVDTQDTSGFTALHIAAIDRKVNRVNLLIENNADLSISNKAGLTSLYFINKKVPQCMKALESRLDSGMKLEGGTSELSSKIKLDFTKLSTSINSYQTQDIAFFMELSSSPHQDLLKHPLSEAFLYLKWNQVKYLYMVFIVLNHFIFSVVHTVYALLLYANVCQPPEDNNENTAERWHIFNSTIPCDLDRSPALTLNLTITAWIFLIVFIVFYLIKEIMKLLARPRSYFQQVESYHDLIIICTTVVIIFLNPMQKEKKIEIGRWQYHAACIGSFSTWLYMMFLIGRVPRFGKYVQMFRTVSMSVMNFMVAYVFLIIAFATAFTIAFPGHEAFGVLPAAIIKLMVMMLGEIEYEDLYYSKEELIVNDTIKNEVKTQMFPVTAHFFLFLFTILVSIILMNLLVGLAVSDIRGLEKSAKLHQLLQQVDLINYMERFLFSPYFKYLPDFFQTYLRKKLQGLQVKCKTLYTVKPHDINDKTIPETLKKSIFENCVRRENQDTMDIQQRDLRNMNRNIQLILSILSRQPDSATKHPDFAHSLSVLSSSTNFSNSLVVDDDIDSDLEVNVERGSTRRRELNCIREEGSLVHRSSSDISSASTESEVPTVSDYVGFEDKELGRNSFS